MKKVAILQSNYIPWKGYFDIIAAVDEFILYDDMQYTKNDWRNRNKIKTPKGLEWLTIPVGQNIERKIREVNISDSRWQQKHWRTLEANYRRAKYFEDVETWLRPLYESYSHENLSSLNRIFIEAICLYLGISTKISNSWDYGLSDGKTERLADLCLQAGGYEYISGPAAKDYIDEGVLNERGIKLTWFDYAGYPEYPQLWTEFNHGVSILDLIFNCGKESPRYMRYVAHDSI
ncbi:WbqC family protein [Pseudomonas sp. BN411]|uniref:WbqC family protein n=1 Tax=Pseudomonas sp. BN411 TaxID=2567887 RepID=UPI002453D293|nr:WbqC family protein [Pseudomonas sp. BN411]MDH4562758.1 hypothetical protein [Pseudomonas sp. BN411]